MQRLLMQSQKQKERQENVHGQQIQIATSTTSSTPSSATLTAKSSPNKDSGGGGTGGGVDFLPINDDTKLNIKDELGDLEDLDDKFLNDFTSDSAKMTGGIKIEIDDIEMDEGFSTVQHNQTHSSDDKENEVHIDPKTYCKLGHFHLLLEEFDKGLCGTVFIFCFVNFEALIFSAFGLSEVL